MKEKETRTIFVIMPFTQTPTRKKVELDVFYQINLKERIENNQSFRYRYIVNRSDDSFNINEKIIKDLFHSDIVLCDLSGHYANPNVMFELGIRLSVSDKPVILFREDNEENKTIFDISGYYIEPYNPHMYRKLEDFIIKKLIDYETDELKYKSPILNILGSEPIILSLIYKRTIIRRLQMLQFSLHSLRAKLCGDVAKFLKGNNINDFPEPLDEFSEWISKNKEDLNKLDWTSCSLNFIKAPVIEYFLANPEIEAAFPSDMQDRFLVYFHTWYDLFLNEREKYKMSLNSVETLLWEIYILHQLVLSLISYANGNDSMREKAYNHFNRIFNMSVIAKYSIESVGILTYIPPRDK